MKIVLVLVSMVVAAWALPGRVDFSELRPGRPCEDAPIDCAAKDEEMDICSDPIDSMAYCPKYCGKCETATEETPPCHDFDQLCPTLVNSHYCTLDIANELCPKSCGFCGMPTTTEEMETTTELETTTDMETTTTALMYTEIPDPNCEDIDPDCITLLQKHYCGDEEIVRKLCQRSCNMCPTILVPVNGQPTTQAGPTTPKPSQPFTTPRVCANYDTSCAEPETLDTCDTDELIQMLCPLACGICTLPTEEVETTEMTTEMTTEEVTTTAPLCEDLDPQCDQLAQNFYCETNALLRRICPNTCGECLTLTTPSSNSNITGECGDLDSQCPELSQFCERDDLIVKYVCKATCNLCPTTPPPTEEPGPYRCRTCVDPFCEREVESTVQCTEEEPYCVSRVINNKDGTHGVTKGCASKASCDRGYLGTAAGNTSVCISFDSNNFVEEEFICFFCCTEDECNRHAKPDPDTLYIPE